MKMSKLIPLTKNKFTIVDDEDYEYLSQWKWYLLNSGYAVRDIVFAGQKKTILMHRFIMNAPENLDIDHINGDGLDNRRSNLRLATISQNMMNRRINSNNTSSYAGISWSKEREKWEVYISVNKKRINLGRYDFLEEAVDTRIKAEKEYFKEFRREKKPTLYILTDLHFFHENIKKYEDRPNNFNEIIVSNWNKIIKQEDTVIVLGDIIFNKNKNERLKPLMEILNGRKILCMGNHDYEEWDFYMENGFDFACDYFIYRNIVFSHAPITPLPPQTQTNFGKEVSYNIHGHFHRGRHRSPENSPDYKDSSYDYQYWKNNKERYIHLQIEDELRPFTLEEVLARRDVKFAKVKSDGRNKKA